MRTAIGVAVVLVFPGLLLLGLLALLLWLCPRSWYLTRIGILGLMALDLGVPAHHLAGFGDGKLLTSMPPAMETILQDHGHDPFPPRAFREPNVEMAVQLGSTPTWQDSEFRALRSLTPNAVNVFGLAVVPGYEAAFPDLTSKLGIRSYPALGMVAKLDDVLPRVYLPGQVRRLPHAEVARHLQDTAVVSGRQVLVSSTEGDRLTGELAEPQACSVSSFANTRIAVSCSASSPTMAVFVEQYDAGWTAVVDGQPAKIERANLFLRGVSLPAGLHRIEMHYRPPGLSLAAFISAIGLLVLVAGMLRRGQAECGNSS